MVKQPAQGFTMQLARLRADYLSRLPGEIAEMRKLAKQLQDCAETEPVLEVLQERLHRLTGTGGTLGFINLSGASRKMEQQIKDSLRDGHCATADARAAIIAGIDQLDLLVTEGGREF